ncbi:MAG: type IV toxin-antitoxin system AbiEi family antitoxin domain-containing protein [Polyangiales bacterium]
MTRRARPPLREGRVYRARDLARWSECPARLAQRLVREGALRRISRGLYCSPIASEFGPAPVTDEALLRAVLAGDPFLVSGPPRWNMLGLGSTAMFAATLVYNTRRTGEFVIDGRRFLFRRGRFPKRPSPEWFVVDLIGHHGMAGVELSELRRRLVTSLRAGRWNHRRLRTLAKAYGTRATIALVDECLARATAGDTMPADDELDRVVVSLARELVDIQRRARALGIFADDRELLTCPNCGLTEDVLIGGRLVTYFGSCGPDTGLRFVEPTSAGGQYTCPRCGGDARSE